MSDEQTAPVAREPGFHPQTETIYQRRPTGLRFHVRSGIFGKLTVHADDGLEGAEAVASALAKYCVIQGVAVTGVDGRGRVEISNGRQSDTVSVSPAPL